MSKGDILRRLAEGVVSLNPDAVREAAQDAVRVGIEPSEAIRRGLSEGMRIVGEKWKTMEYFMSEIIMAADAYMQGLDVLKQRLTPADSSQFLATMVIGTIYGDIHSIGKAIAVPVFQASGLNVIDLGVDVPPQKFVEAVKQYNAEIVGLGTYMSETFFNTPIVIEALKKAGLRDRVKVICGGPAVDARTAKRLGADDASSDAFEAVDKMKRLLEELRRERA